MADAPKRFVVQVLLDMSRFPDGGVRWSSSFDTAEDAMQAANAALRTERVLEVRESIEQEVIDTETKDRWVRVGTGPWEVLPATS